MILRWLLGSGQGWATHRVSRRKNVTVLSRTFPSVAGAAMRSAVISDGPSSYISMGRLYSRQTSPDSVDLFYGRTDSGPRTRIFANVALSFRWFVLISAHFQHDAQHGKSWYWRHHFPHYLATMISDTSKLESAITNLLSHREFGLVRCSQGGVRHSFPFDLRLRLTDCELIVLCVIYLY